VGGFSALVNFLSRIALSQFMSFRLAVVYAYLVGMLTAYVLSRLFVFERSGRHPASELFWFSVVNVFAIIQVWVISVGLAEYAFPRLQVQFYPEAIAHLIGLGVPVITSYFGHKYFSFKKITKKEVL
jgi:putative flippase GtrA